MGVEGPCLWWPVAFGALCLQLIHVLVVQVVAGCGAFTFSQEWAHTAVSLTSSVKCPCGSHLKRGCVLGACQECPVLAASLEGGFQKAQSTYCP